VKTVRLKYLARSVRTPADSGQYVGLENVESATGKLVPEASEIEPTSAVSFKVGDVLYGKLRPYLRKVLVAPFNGRCSSEFLVLRPAPGVDSRFLSYLLLSDPVTSWSVTNSDGAKMPRTEWDVVGQTRVACPRPGEQTAIGDHLDRETARIDALIAKKERLLALSEERKWNRLISLIHQTDTRSLPIRRLLLFITDGPFGSAFSSSDYSEYGAAVVRLGNIGFGEYRSEDQARIPMPLYRQFPRCHVSPGDVLIAGLGDANNHAGRACVAPDLGAAMVKGKCFCARVNRSRVTPGYLAWLLASPLGAELVGALGQGSTRTMINLELIKSLAIPVPNVAEQESLIRDFDRERERIAAMSLGLHRQVALLRQKRQALITATVTGQIPVPGAA
jgi:type I restriction enzyme S subunit